MYRTKDFYKNEEINNMKIVSIVLAYNWRWKFEAQMGDITVDKWAIFWVGITDNWISKWDFVKLWI